jgi:hypothetical protein
MTFRQIFFIKKEVNLQQNILFSKNCVAFFANFHQKKKQKRKERLNECSRV